MASRTYLSSGLRTSLPTVRTASARTLQRQVPGEHNTVMRRHETVCRVYEFNFYFYAFFQTAGVSGVNCRAALKRRFKRGFET